MRNNILLMPLIGLVVISVSGKIHSQTIDEDSIGFSKMLSEVVVSAPKVIKKHDRDVYLPSADSKKISKNGVQLLMNMGIPSLAVNEILGSVTSLGSEVQIRVNGRVTSVEQLKTILPENVRKVEWIQNPGLKYNGASAVLNLIVVNPTLGGSLMTQATSALNTEWGEAYLSAKLNNGRSQWGLDINGKLGDFDSQRDYQESFTYPDGTTVTRREIPIAGKAVHKYLIPKLSYSYIKPDTTVIYASFGYNKNWRAGTSYTGLMKYSDGTPDIEVTDDAIKEFSTPTISAYLEQHFGKNRILSVDASASFYSGRTPHYYSERVVDSNQELTEINSMIKDANNGYAITADYTQNWEKSRFTAGATYSAQRNKSTYENLGGLVSRQHTDNAYIFAEYARSIGKVDLTGGVGADYSSVRLIESGTGTHSWRFRPRVTMNYNATSHSRFYLGFYTWQDTPGLSQTNPVEQQVDGVQWHRGNQSLNTTITYRIDAQYRYYGNRISGTAGINAQMTPDAIAPVYFWEGPRLIQTYENSRGRKYISAYISPDINVIPGWLNLSGYLRWSLTHTSGTGYSLTRPNWCGQVTATAYHWGFYLVAQYDYRQGFLTGELEAWGERHSTIAIQYGWRNWQFMAGVICPFGSYDQPSALYNRYYSYDRHMRLKGMSPMPIVKVSYNLNWGRQKRGVNKRVNADSSVKGSESGQR